MATSRIVQFYDPDVGAPFHPGETSTTLHNVLKWSDKNLEDRHDYIQHLFPLPERSGPNPSAPVLTPGIRDAFHNRPELRQNLLKVFDRMCDFYGLDLVRTPAGYKAYTTGGTDAWRRNLTRVDRLVSGKFKYAEQHQHSFDRMRDSWLTNFDHNHLRITRIVRSLRILGEPQAALWFVTVMGELEKALWPETINRRTLDIWLKAATRPLHLPPDDRQAECAWLRDPDEDSDATARDEECSEGKRQKGWGNGSGEESNDGEHEISYEEVRAMEVPKWRLREALER